MPRSATTGVFTRVVNSFSQPVFGTLIDPTDADAYFDDLDVGLNPPILPGPLTLTGALNGGTAVGSTLTLQSTSNVAPVGDSTTIVGTTINLKAIGGGVTVNLGVAGVSGATVNLAGSTSGATTIAAAAIASGAWSLPAVTDTFVGKATTDILTNKTLTNPAINGATILTSTYNKVTITAPATSATLTLIDGTTLTGPAASGTVMTLGNNETVTGVKTFGAAGNVGKLVVAGTTSGSTVLNATAIASGTLTLPAATDTLIGKATTDILTNKTYDTAGAGNSFSINSLAATANTGTGSVVRATSPTITTPAVTGDMSVSGIVQTGGFARTTAQFDKTSNTTPSDITGLTVNVTSGLTYEFEAYLFYTANAASGVKGTIAGTCTATAIIFETFITINPSGFAGIGKSTSLGSVSTGATGATGDVMWMRGTITVNAGGTLTAQFAQNVSGGVASSVLIGSTLKVWKIA